MTKQREGLVVFYEELSRQEKEFVKRQPQIKKISFATLIFKLIPKCLFATPTSHIAMTHPVIRMSMPLIKDTTSDDEVAFVMSHEFGHLIGQHIEKQRKQALTGALILGAITAYGNTYAASAGQYYDPNSVAKNMELGAAVGSKAYSQTYELESDTLAVYIAKAAGYDPIKGAEFFARPEDVRTSQGNLSFWGTHPPDEKTFSNRHCCNKIV